jgi:membrane-associated phospholipid phosphatase
MALIPSYPYRLSTLLLILLIITSVVGQSPYKLTGGKEGVLLGSGAALGGLTLFLNTTVEPLTAIEIAMLDAENINWLDRGAVNHFSGSANRRSDYGERVPFVGGLISPFIFPLVLPKGTGYGREMLTLLVLWSEVNLLSSATTHAIKSWTKRARPFVYNPELSLDIKQTVNARKSSISGHTSASAANMFFLAKVYSDYFPDSRLRPWIWSIAAVVPAWTGVERYLAGKHFPTDIIPAYALGAICGYFIPHLHRRTETEREAKLTLTPYSVYGVHGFQVLLRF